MLMLSAIRHFVRITLSTPPEAQLSMCLLTVKDERWQQPKSGGIMQNIERGCACFQEKYYKVCIARAAVNESVCEDSHTEHM